MHVDEQSLRAIDKRWHEAEQRLKRVELIHGVLIVPVVNELRYAGYHVLCALLADSAEKAVRDLHEAEDHCARAHYDAVEAEILFHLESYEAFAQDFRGIEIAVDGFDWFAVMTAAEEARNSLILDTEQRAHRAQHYKTVSERCEPLHKAIAQMNLARGEMSKKLEAKRIADQRTRRKWIAGTVIGAVAAAAASITATMNFRRDSRETSGAGAGVPLMAAAIQARALSPASQDKDAGTQPPAR